MPDCRDTGIFHGNEGEIGSDRRGKLLGGLDAPVVSLAFQLIEKIGIQQADSTNARQNGQRKNYGRTFGALELHAV